MPEANIAEFFAYRAEAVVVTKAKNESKSGKQNIFVKKPACKRGVLSDCLWVVDALSKVDTPVYQCPRYHAI